MIFFWFIVFIVLLLLAWQDYKEQQVCSEGITAFVFACIVNAWFALSNFNGILFWVILPFVLVLTGTIALADFIVLLFLPLWLGVNGVLQVFFLTLMMLSTVWLSNCALKRKVNKTYFLPFLVLALIIKYSLTLIGITR